MSKKIVEMTMAERFQHAERAEQRRLAKIASKKQSAKKKKSKKK